MKKFLALMMALMMVLSLCACSSGSKTKEEDKGLVGQWEYDGISDYVYTFNEDGTGSYSFSGAEMKFTYEDKGDSFSILYDGNTDPAAFEYVIEGDKLTITDSFGEPVVYFRK